MNEFEFTDDAASSSSGEESQVAPDLPSTSGKVPNGI